LAREAQGKKPKDDSRGPDYRSLRFHGTSSRLKGYFDLPHALGQLVHHAIDRIADAEGIDEVTGEYQPAYERRADALVTLAGISTAGDSDPDLATVVIHVELPSLLAGQYGDDSVVDVDGRAVMLKDVIDSGLRRSFSACL